MVSCDSQDKFNKVEVSDSTGGLYLLNRLIFVDLEYNFSNLIHCYPEQLCAHLNTSLSDLLPRKVFPTADFGNVLVIFQRWMLNQHHEYCNVQGYIQ